MTSTLSVRNHRPVGSASLLRTNQSEVQQVERDGRQYLVFPVIAAREMVLDYPENGTRELLPAAHLSESLPMWAGTPISFIHPENKGSTVEDPEQYTGIVIGQAHEPEIVDDEKLRVQAWVDIEKARDIGGLAEDVIEMLRAGEDLSVSAGYATIDDDRSGGVYEGEEYDIEQGHIIPDHIAIFPSDEFLARCTWEDGCGAPRLNAMNSDSYSSNALNAGNISMVPQEGHRVEWEQDGRPSYGVVVDTIPEGEVYDGVIDEGQPVPGPAALIEKYMTQDDHYVSSGRMVAVPMSELRVVEDFPRPARHNGLAPLPRDQSYCTAGPCQCGMHDPRVNALSEARTPTYDGLTSASWDAPSFTDYVSEWYDRQDRDPPDQIQTDEVANDAIEFAARRTLVGDPDADSADEAVSFPVVNTDDELNENALTAARNLAYNSDAEDSIKEVAASLLEEHSSGDETWPSDNTYDFSDDNNTNAMSETDGDPLATALGRRVLNALGISDGAESETAGPEDLLGADESMTPTDDESTDPDDESSTEDDSASVDSEAESDGSDDDEPTDDDSSGETESSEETEDTDEGGDVDEEQTEETTDSDDGDSSDADDTETTMPDTLSIEQMAAKSAFGVQTLQEWDDEQLMALEATILENNPELAADSGGESTAETEADSGDSESNSGDRKNNNEDNESTTDDGGQTRQNADDLVTKDEFAELKSMVEDIANQKENAEKTRKARQVANAVEGMSEDAAKELPEETLDDLYDEHANTVNMAGVPGPASRQPDSADDEEVEEYPAGGRTNYQKRKQGGD